MKALLKNYRQSPRKVRLIADMIRGKDIASARAALAFMPKKSVPDIQKLLDSAVANARSSGHDADALVVKTISVDKATVMRRFKPMARGRAARFARTMSTIRMELGAQAAPKAQSAKPRKTATKATKAQAKAKTK
jgi:large subunit ribosomal protein L22